VPQIIRILAIDGGGIGGIIPAQLLTRLAVDHPQLIEKADIVAGTSTGGLIALGLADQRPPDFVASLYLKRGREIFGRSMARMPPFDWVRAKYSPAGLRSIMVDEFKDKTLAQLAKPVVIPTVALQRGDDKQSPDGKHKHTPAGIFLSTVPLKAGCPPDKTKYESDKWSCVDAALATSAAPTYFPAHRVGGWRLWDGGLVANNPSAVALGEARRSYPRGTEFTILSLGTGYGQHATPAGDWGKLQAVKEIIATALDTSVGSTAFLLRQEMGDRYLRLSFEMKDYAMDDPTAIPDLRDFVNDEYGKTKDFGQTDGSKVDVLKWLKQWW
jgi:patatin-like phospholipase/acyl hydrolase